MQTYLATWQVTVSFLMYFVVIVMVAPVPALLLIVFLGLISILLRRFVRQTFQLGEQTVRVRADIFDFISERHSAWKTIKLFNTAEMETQNFNRLSSSSGIFKARRSAFGRKNGDHFCATGNWVSVFILYILVEFLKSQGWDPFMMFGVVMLRLIPVAQSYQKKIKHNLRNLTLP